MATTGPKSLKVRVKPLLSAFHPLRVTAVLMVMVAFVFFFSSFVCLLALNLHPGSHAVLCLSRPARHQLISTQRISSTLARGPCRFVPVCVGGSEIVLHLFQFCLTTCITTCSWSAQRATKEFEQFKPSCSVGLLSAEVEIK